MAIAVPRSADAHVPGLERARDGASAQARERSARADALSDARSCALRAVATPEGLAEWCTLAAANPDMSAKVLLELMGQGARGPCRTRAWIQRNGARICKGERGYAVSMFGGWVWRLRQTTGRFGDVGLSADGAAPRDEVEGWTGICGGDPVAGAIICAMRGYRLGSVAATVGAETLERSLRIVRGVAFELPGCLSCDGAGCLLCSCDDGKSRAPVLYCDPVEPRPAPEGSVKAPARRGRPRAVRPELPDVERSVKAAREMQAEAERLMAEAAEIKRAAMERSVKAGYSLADVAAAAGVTKSRVAQILGRY